MRSLMQNSFLMSVVNQFNPSLKPKGCGLFEIRIYLYSGSLRLNTLLLFMKISAIFSTLLLSLLFCAQSNAELAQGFVFEDLNGNGLKDPGEPGIAGVAVSNQVDVVLSGADGGYQLPVSERTILFVSKPNGYELPRGDDQLPKFYYLHFPEGSPTDFTFPGIAPTGSLPDSVDFALVRAADPKKFTAIVTGDPQPHSQIEVDYFRDDIVAEMMHEDADLYIALGDIVFDHLDLYPRYIDVVSQLGLPAYNIHGNHDMNYRAVNDEFAAETFRDYFGPEYYSFDYGDVHFIVIDDVLYKGWNVEGNHYGGYTGRITDRQLTWMRNDLAHVSEDKLVVISKHIPLLTLKDRDATPDNYLYIENLEEFFDVVKDRKKILALSGHTHLTEVIKVDERHGWNEAGEFWNVNPGAACGAWWTGPKDVRGIPAAYCMDGSPNGYFMFEFDGTDYEYTFRPANLPREHQIRVSTPVGSVKSCELSKVPVVANVFVGGVDTDVKCRVGDGAWVPMQKQEISDVFMQDYFISYRETMPSWLQSVAVSSHIWTCELPVDLAPGMHTVEVVAVDHQGHELTGYSLIEVVGDCGACCDKLGNASAESLLAGTHQAVAYSGFREGQHPDRGDGAVNPSNEEILEDLQILLEHGFNLIRLYDSGENSASTLKIIKENKLPIQVMLGAWLDAEVSNHEGCPWLNEPIPAEKLAANRLKNDAEVQTAIQLANAYPGVVIAINVGNEALVSWNDHMMPVERVIELVKKTKAETNVLVTVAENFYWWAHHGEALGAEVDFIGIHTYPAWEGKTVDEAMMYSLENIADVQDAIPGKPIAILEAGWATTSVEFGDRAGEPQQKQYFNELMNWSEKHNVTTFFFEAFDEPWKGDPGNALGAEKHWGLFFENRTPKEVMK